MKESLPDRALPRYLICWYQLKMLVTWWPWTTRRLRKAGFTRTGWMSWEYPGEGR